jgi:hypothetical protein
LNDFIDYFLVFIMLVLASPLLLSCLVLLRSTLTAAVAAMLVLAGTPLFYRMVVGVADRVTIAAGGGYLVVRYHPLPWPGVTTASNRIRKLYVERYGGYAVGRGRGRISPRVLQRNRPDAGITYTYQLRAMVNDGPDIRLLGGLSSMEDGQYLEQTLEQHLGIADYRSRVI